jgi:hypothetical protein
MTAGVALTGFAFYDAARRSESFDGTYASRAVPFSSASVSVGRRLGKCVLL